MKISYLELRWKVRRNVWVSELQRVLNTLQQKGWHIYSIEGFGARFVVIANRTVKVYE